MAADPKIKSENGNASETTATVDYTVYPPPPGPSEKPAVTLTPAQAEMHKKVLEHFQSESYKLPGVQDGGELEDEEKFWLVRFSFLSLSLSLFFFFVMNTRSETDLMFFWFSLTIACCGEEVSSLLRSCRVHAKIHIGNMLLEIGIGICALRNGIRQMWPSKGWRVRSSGGVNMASTISQRTWSSPR